MKIHWHKRAAAQLHQVEEYAHRLSDKYYFPFIML